jgi:hypothetical protein
MRPTGPARHPFRPGLDSLLDAAGRRELVRTFEGRYRDLSGRAVDQTLARTALLRGEVRLASHDFAFSPDLRQHVKPIVTTEETS